MGLIYLYIYSTFYHPLRADKLKLTFLGCLNDTGFLKDLKSYGNALFIIRRIPGFLYLWRNAPLLLYWIRVSLFQHSGLIMDLQVRYKSRARQLRSLTKQHLCHKLQLQSDFTVTCHTEDLWEMWTAFDVSGRWQFLALQWLWGLNCIFSQAAGVADLSAHERQCGPAMEKTHVRPPGGKVEVPDLTGHLQEYMSQFTLILC